jgi:hypothetical protein
VNERAADALNIFSGHRLFSRDHGRFPGSESPFRVAAHALSFQSGLKTSYHAAMDDFIEKIWADAK